MGKTLRVCGHSPSEARAQQGVRLMLEKLATVWKHLIEKYCRASTVA